MTVNHTSEQSATEDSVALTPVVVKLLKGVLYRDDDPKLWQSLLTLQARARDYVAVLGLELLLDEAEGYAWLRTRPADETGDEPPRLMARRPLSFPVSLLIALLRRKLAEADTQGGETRLILDRADVIDLMRTFLPETSNEARLVDQIDGYLNKVAELGFIRRLRNQKDKVEVRRILKAYVDAQWLGEFEAQLRAYRAHIAPDGNVPESRSSESHASENHAPASETQGGNA